MPKEGTEMERLTIEFCGHWVPQAICSVGADGLVDDCDGCAEHCENDCEKCGIQKSFDRLASYENTGLEPEAIKKLKEKITVRKMSNLLGIYRCPDCGEALNPIWNHCPWCGQHVTEGVN